MAPPPQVTPQTRRRARASLSDLSAARDIESLSVRQLKEILARNFVNYSGCCEKWELVERVGRLYRETEENRRSSGCCRRPPARPPCRCHPRGSVPRCCVWGSPLVQRCVQGCTMRRFYVSNSVCYNLIGSDLGVLGYSVLLGSDMQAVHAKQTNRSLITLIGVRSDHRTSRRQPPLVVEQNSRISQQQDCIPKRATPLCGIFLVTEKTTLTKNALSLSDFGTLSRVHCHCCHNKRRQDKFLFPFNILFYY